MTMFRLSPATLSTLRDLPSIEDEVSRLFDSALPGAPRRGDLNAGFTPRVDVEETAEEFIFRADLPGVAQKDVKVTLMGDTLTIRGERTRESGAKDGKSHRIERLYGAFERAFTLGSPVRNDQVKAQYRDGVLEVRVPKAEEARVREVEIQLG